MKKTDLNENFLNILKEKFPKQTTLITVVEDILKIERESAYRRIKGTVQFSIREMGILAQQLNISLDYLLLDEQTNLVHLNMYNPRFADSLDIKADEIKKYIEKLKIPEAPFYSEMGTVHAHLPLELYTTYPSLFKFIFFKWGHYYVGTEKYKDFTQWRVPEKLMNYNLHIMDLYQKITRILYIWDKSIIWNLVNDIKYFSEAGILEYENINEIKKDIHCMLNDLEALIAAGGPKEDPEKIEFYISNINIGISYSYFCSQEYCFNHFTTFFINSTIDENEHSCKVVKQWVNSLKKVSTLISGSGDKERLLFFKEQHIIVDSIQ